MCYMWNTFSFTLSLFQCVLLCALLNWIEIAKLRLEPATSVMIKACYGWSCVDSCVNRHPGYYRNPTSRWNQWHPTTNSKSTFQLLAFLLLSFQFYLILSYKFIVFLCLTHLWKIIQCFKFHWKKKNKLSAFSFLLTVYCKVFCFVWNIKFMWVSSSIEGIKTNSWVLKSELQ